MMGGLEREQRGSMTLKPPDDGMRWGGGACVWVILLPIVLLSRVRLFTSCFPGGETWMDELRETAVKKRDGWRTRGREERCVQVHVLVRRAMQEAKITGGGIESNGLI